MFKALYAQHLSSGPGCYVFFQAPQKLTLQIWKSPFMCCWIISMFPLRCGLCPVSCYVPDKLTLGTTFFVSCLLVSARARPGVPHVPLLKFRFPSNQSWGLVSAVHPGSRAPSHTALSFLLPITVSPLCCFSHLCTRLCTAKLSEQTGSSLPGQRCIQVLFF